MKAFLLLVFLPLVASAQTTYTFSQMQEPGGHTLYCATTASGFQSCIMDQPNWWDQLKASQPTAQADPAPATFAFNTSESHTGGGGALELGLLLSVMGIQRYRRK